jgi:transcriptional regulator with XRE-family HTH domain
MTPEIVLKRIRGQCVECGDCLRWANESISMRRRQHPMAQVNGKPALVRRALYEGELQPIKPGYSLQPNCGDKLCLEPLHQKQVPSGKAAIGSKSLTRAASVAATFLRVGRTKLTPERRAEIDASNEQGKVLAERMGVSPDAISKYRCGKCYAPANPFAGLGAR